MNIALIPARSGSKGIPHKNIRMILGKPLLAYSIEDALEAKLVDRVIVDTDSEQYAELAREYGAETPYIRPSRLAQDESSDFDVFENALQWVAENEGLMPSNIVHLRPTYPFRDVGLIDQALRIIEENPDWDSVRSVSVAPHTPFKMWWIKDDLTLCSVIKDCGISEPYNQPRQALPVVFQQNACIDVVRSRTIVEQKSMTGKKIGALQLNHFLDIDTWSDFEKSAKQLLLRSHPRKKIFVVSIEKLLSLQPKKEEPDMPVICSEIVKILNKLRRCGNQIYISTFQMKSNQKRLEKNLKNIGLEYDNLQFGRVQGDYYLESEQLSCEELRAWSQQPNLEN